MKNLKKVLAVLLSACFVLSFTACDDSGDTNEGNGGKDDSAAADTDFDYYGDYAEDISGDIEFYQQKPEIEDYMYEVIDDFNALYPNITVNQNVQQDASSTLQARVNNGEFTDVWLYLPTDMK